MQAHCTALEDQIQEYWTWVFGALILLIPMDMLTTMYATAIYGIGFEANPLMRWVLQRGIVETALFNLAILVLVALFFHAFMELIRDSDHPHDWILSRTLEVYLGLFNAAGLFLLANNTSVIFHGQSLI